MKYALMAAAAALAFSAPAYAQTINANQTGLGSNSSDNVLVSGNNNGGHATGGAATGGSATVGDIDARGGAGGSATSTLGSLNSFGGQGGSVLGSGNSSNTNANTNLQGQGQLQGQVASSDQAQSQSQNTHQANAQTNSQSVGGQTSTNTANVDASDRSVTTYEAQDRNPVNTAYAAPLSVGGGVCVYTAASAGGSGVTLSLSGSVAKRDAECDRRAFADMMARLGDIKAARALLMQNEDVATAYKAGIGGDTMVVGGAQPRDSSNATATHADEPKAFSFTPMQPIPN